MLYNEETNNTYDVCLKLTKEALTIQKLDVVCTNGSESQGGAEHNVPVVISKIFKDQVADQTGKLFVGDAVLQVNGINVGPCTHEEVVHLLRTAGDEVTITVRYLREVPSFLKLPLGSPGPSTDHSRVSSPLFDSGLHLNGNGNNTHCAYGLCKSDSRYPISLEGGVIFYPFPKPKTREERCRQWIKKCGRPHAQLNMANINKHKYVCSKTRSSMIKRSRKLIALFMYSTQAPSPPSPSANEPKYEKRWLDAVSCPC
ncbi:hypothetical protein F7725_007694 [Dissostichus mawsoni]|uniref:PDZ domain-containing protein n=1 Tax=Dissostichus mawsoni TaxID=36200 RepID=A0A7J5Y668_DISMA|nr:hypothetical protein F7725_007694 [Dissostichus mawsoni]